MLWDVHSEVFVHRSTHHQPGPDLARLAPDDGCRASTATPRPHALSILPPAVAATSAGSGTLRLYAALARHPFCCRAPTPIHHQHKHVVPSCVLPAAAFEVPAEVTNEVPAAERQAIYSTASCLFVTTRILVVDQLSGRITADQVAGMIVLNAHR